MRLLFGPVLCALTIAFFVPPAEADQVRFVALGDMPYQDNPDAASPPFEKLLVAISGRKPDFVLHIGDTKTGKSPCSRAHLERQLVYMNAIDSAVIYTPGDNEWTDCHANKSLPADPLVQLASIRELYFNAENSLGQKPIGVTRQPASGEGAPKGYPENARTIIGGSVLVVTAHVVGSNNNFDVRAGGSDRPAAAEFPNRDRADRAWITDSFALAKGNDGIKAVVLGIHGDMFRSAKMLPDKIEFGTGSGFDAFGRLLFEEAAKLDKPVLLVYGDSHQYKVHQPHTGLAPKLHALQVPGDQDVRAVEVTVDNARPEVFSFAFVAPE